MKYLTPALVVICLGLSACGDGSPSNSDVKKAVKEMYDKRNQPTESIKVVECEPTKKEGIYRCAVAVHFEGESTILQMPHVLEKANGKWFASGGRRQTYRHY